MTFIDFLVCMTIGFVAGGLGGMLGIGGSLIMIPALAVLFGSRLADGPAAQHLYQAAAMIINIVVAMSALSKHMRKKAVRFDALKGMAIAALITIGLGVWLSNQIDGERLAQIFALFLAYVVFVNARRLKGEIRAHLADRKADREADAAAADAAATAAEPAAMGNRTESPDAADNASHRPLRNGGGNGNSAIPATAAALDPVPLPRSMFVGSIVGGIAGLLGIGGGAIAVPLQQMVFRNFPLQHCIGTSTAVMSITSIVGALLKNITLPEHGVSIRTSLMLAAALLPGAIFGGYLGAILTHRLPTPWIRAVFIILLALAAAKMAGLI